MFQLLFFAINEYCLFFLGNLCIKKLDLFEIWRKEYAKKEKFDAVLKYVVDKIEVNILSDEMEEHISQTIHFFA